MIFFIFVLRSRAEDGQTTGTWPWNQRRTPGRRHGSKRTGDGSSQHSAGLPLFFLVGAVDPLLQTPAQAQEYEHHSQRARNQNTPHFRAPSRWWRQIIGRVLAELGSILNEK
jgi:hypothetical protein